MEVSMSEAKDARIFMELDELSQYFSPAELTKHLAGQHDQSSHGSWAVILNPDVASKIIQLTQDWGGLSINMVDGSLPTGGYMVSKPPEFGIIVDAGDFGDPVKGPKILSDYMKQHKKNLVTGKNYLGTWLHEGKVYLDVSENIQSRLEATRVGRKRNQIKIWDVANQEEIDTGGTGLVEKRSQDGAVEKPSRYDRRGDRRIREANLGQSSGEKKVTVFVKPPFRKHLAGQHDQSSHGSWAEGLGETLNIAGNLKIINEKSTFSEEMNHEHRSLDVEYVTPDGEKITLSATAFKNHNKKESNSNNPESWREPIWGNINVEAFHEGGSKLTNTDYGKVGSLTGQELRNGRGSLSSTVGEPTGFANIDALFVHPKFRRIGIATAMFLVAQKVSPIPIRKKGTSFLEDGQLWADSVWKQVLTKHQAGQHDQESHGRKDLMGGDKVTIAGYEGTWKLNFRQPNAIWLVNQHDDKYTGRNKAWKFKTMDVPESDITFIERP